MRARELDIAFDGEAGAFNAITDVPGVEVGSSTLITEGPEYGARTGVTAIFPLGRAALEGVLAGSFALNGTGEMTGLAYVEETGRHFGPVMLTGTLNLSTVHRGVLEWTREHFADTQVRYCRHLPMVAETYDGFLNREEFAFHLATAHVIDALDSARGGQVAEGNVGGGTAMMTYQFSGGTGTASRVFRFGGEQYTLGVLVQSNHGCRGELTISGVPLGKHLRDDIPVTQAPEGSRDGSIIIVVATDAPLLPDQLKRVARRATIGLALTGGRANTGSGDIFFAFTTANRVPVAAQERLLTFRSVPHDHLTPVFDATVQATEEAIVNALVSSRTLRDGRGGVIHGLPVARVVRLLAAYGRLASSPPIEE